MNDMMTLSHILYKVKNLEEAVKDFEDMGFTVRYGAKKEKAFNALIWFEEGPFIELYTISKWTKVFVFLAKLIGKGAVARRFQYFIDSDYGWSEYSLENNRYELEAENAMLKQLGCQYSTINASRKNIYGQKLRWKLSMPLDLGIPFFMSAYKPNPRPQSIEHRNGAKSVRSLTWGVPSENIEIIQQFTDDSRLQLEVGSGFQSIELEGFDGERLNQPYYK